MKAGARLGEIIGWRRGGHLFAVAVAIACGLAGALGAVVFRLLIRLSQALFFEGPAGAAAVIAEGWLAEAGDPRAVAQGVAPRALLIAIPALGGLVVGPLVWFFAREARGHGVPEVMEAVALRGGVMRPRIALVKTLASALCIGSGGSVGREGPIVQIGAAIGSALGQWLRVPARQLRTIVGCGAAAGIAATFNAPIAGALFAVEVIVGDFAVTQFSPIVISAVVATVASRWLLGNEPAFAIPEYEVGGPLELFSFMAVGVLAGLVGSAFVRVLYRSEDAFVRVPLPEWSKAALGGALVGCIGMAFPHIFGVGYSTIADALNGELPLLMLGVLLGVKILATSITIGSGGSGGVFAPSLFLGAAAGGFFGKLGNAWFPGSLSDSGLYALVTMGAMVAATTHAPLSAMVIIFELTQKIEVIPPVMAACVVSSLLAMRLSRESIYTMKLARRGVDIHREDDPNILKSMFVREIVDRAPGVVRASAPLPEVLGRVVEGDHTELFVVDDAGRLLGAIRFPELRRTIFEQDSLRSLVVAGDLLEPPRASVTEDDDLDLAMGVFGNEDVEEIPVVERDDPRKLAGAIRKRDVIAAYSRELMRRDLAGGFGSAVAVVNRVHQVDLGGGYVVQELLAPRTFTGRSLRELDIRARAGVQVLLIRSPEAGGAASVRVPGPRDVIASGDRLIVAGPKQAVDDIAGRA